MDTDERVSVLEARIAQYDKWLTALILYAKLTPAGRKILKIMAVA
jgi:hypothetical protein